MHIHGEIYHLRLINEFMCCVETVNFLNPISDERARIEELIYHTLIKEGYALYIR